MLSRCRWITRVSANKASDWQRGQRTAESPIASQSLQRWAFARLTKLDWRMTVHLACRLSSRAASLQKNPRLGLPGYRADGGLSDMRIITSTCSDPELRQNS